ncbi:unnamed protein product [Didymodactylos carnosus]|uniref:SET domain-containing protein n=1 Tax=Didymodactylos carnosus TaxID=1234261 RepID=A0A815I4J1_9BILA|nr:unnamed protein product [Didymodactylos carnosus]CAF4243242.1 unnamed protein product [Didymodactylos carnosus]
MQTLFRASDSQLLRNICNWLTGPARDCCAPNIVCNSADKDDNNGHIYFETIKNIKTGEIMTVDYLLPMESIMSTSQRRAILKHQYYFDCECSRCICPDNCRLLKCLSCNIGYIELDGESKESIWKCN